MNISAISIVKNNTFIKATSNKPSAGSETCAPSFMAKISKKQLTAATTLAGLDALAINNITKSTASLSSEKTCYATPEDFAKHGINVIKIDKNDGLYTIDNLENNSYNKEQKEFIKKHFYQIKKIAGNAIFKNIDITSLQNLEKINGFASFSGSNITDTGKLREIRKNAYFSTSKITGFGNIKKIGGDVDLYNSQISTWGNLREIGGDVYIENNSKLPLENIKQICKKAIYICDNITGKAFLYNISKKEKTNQSNLYISSFYDES